MNVRQQKYKKNILTGMSKYAAARAAGYSHSMATQAKNIEKRIDMQTELEMAGLTDRALAQHAAEGLKAQRSVSLLMQEGDHVWRDVFKEPDWNARSRYLNAILILRGDKKSDNDVNVNVQVAITNLVKDINQECERLFNDSNGRYSLD